MTEANDSSAAQPAATPSAENKAATAPAPGAAPKGSNRVRQIAILALLCGALAGTWYWYVNRDFESTDDAFVDGRAIAVSPQISGEVVELNIADNQFVHKGDVLLRIDPRQYHYARDLAEGALITAKAQLGGQQYGYEVAQKNFPALLAQAEAQLAAANAALNKAQADYDRQKNLSKLATSAQDVDAAKAALEQAKAQVALAQAQVLQASPVPQRIGEIEKQIGQQQGQIEQAQARLDQATLNLAWTEIRAPQDGWITKRNVEMGNNVAPGQQLFSIVSPDVWVTANFKENQLARMKPGQNVKLEIDAFPDLKLDGHVDSIQLGTGSKFTAFPPENATGNFVKVVQRVPVKIVIDKGLDPERPLALGMSAVPSVSLK